MSSMGAPVPHKLAFARKSHSDNAAFYETPATVEAWNNILKHLGKDDEAFAGVLKDISCVALEDAIAIYLPAVPGYRAWQPWVRNYHGESTGGTGSVPFFIQYLWVDHGLKESMGY